MLVGTVVNNGILYVDTVNQYRREMDLNTALVEAGATRLRPIPVSYTHLDVYKRQTRRWNLKSMNSPI